MYEYHMVCNQKSLCGFLVATIAVYYYYFRTKVDIPGRSHDERTFEITASQLVRLLNATILQVSSE